MNRRRYLLLGLFLTIAVAVAVYVFRPESWKGETAERPSASEESKQPQRSHDEFVAEARKFARDAKAATPKNFSTAAPLLEKSIEHFKLALENPPDEITARHDIQRELADTHLAAAELGAFPGMYPEDPPHEAELVKFSKDHYAAAILLFEKIAAEIVAQRGPFPATQEELDKFRETIANGEEGAEGLAYARSIHGAVEYAAAFAYLDAVSHHETNSESWNAALAAAIAKNEQVEKDFILSTIGGYAGLNVARLHHKAGRHSEAWDKLQSVENRIDDLEGQKSQFDVAGRVMLLLFDVWHAMREHGRVLDRGDEWLRKEKVDVGSPGTELEFAL